MNEVRRNPALRRSELSRDGAMAVLEYEEAGAGVPAFTHTFVPEAGRTAARPPAARHARRSDRLQGGTTMAEEDKATQPEKREVRRDEAQATLGNGESFRTGCICGVLCSPLVILFFPPFSSAFPFGVLALLLGCCALGSQYQSRMTPVENDDQSRQERCCGTGKQPAPGFWGCMSAVSGFILGALIAIMAALLFLCMIMRDSS